MFFYDMNSMGVIRALLPLKWVREVKNFGYVL